MYIGTFPLEVLLNIESFCSSIATKRKNRAVFDVRTTGPHRMLHYSSVSVLRTCSSRAHRRSLQKYFSPFTDGVLMLPFVLAWKCPNVMAFVIDPLYHLRNFALTNISEPSSILIFSWAKSLSLNVHLISFGSLCYLFWMPQVT